MSNYLITGGTGSFGRACTKALLKVPNANKIIIYSRDEHKHEQMEREIGKDDRIRYFIGDIRDKDRLRLAVREANYIIHAAALKIVPAGEYNPMEFVKTNIVGAQNLIDVCLENPYPRKIIALSTDKAVAPKNLYGATKICAEKLFLASNALGYNGEPRFSVVRYGNVANSNGSVIKVFDQQLMHNHPLTITDERMTRFWITLDEAVEFTLRSLNQMQGGETFIPNMPSFRVTDLAEAMVERGGFGRTYPIRYMGIRPGEKLHEEIEEGRSSENNNVWLDKEALINQLIGLDNASI